MSNSTRLANEDNILIPFIEISTYRFTISVSQMRFLSTLCKRFFVMIQKKLKECDEIRARWGPILAKKIVPYLVGRTHPFKYSGSCVKFIPINVDIGIGQFGVRLLDTGRPIFTDEELAATRYAFANIGFFTRKPVAFSMVMFIARNPILSVEVRPDDYIDRGEAIPRDIAAYRMKYGDIKSDWPGRYYVNLNLPTRFNPVILGEPIISMNRLSFSISTEYSAYCDGFIFGPTEIDFIIDNFTHSVVKFLRVGELEYDWERYCLTYRGPINEHVWTTSLVRSRDDPKVVENEQPAAVPQTLNINLGAVAVPPGADYQQVIENILLVQQSIWARMFGENGMPPEADFIDEIVDAPSQDDTDQS